MTTIHSAEIISVGTELLLGETVDTNSSFLANELANRGVDVYWSQRVGDNFPRLVAALQAATGRSDLVLLTGGLGPTADDLTREAVAAVMGEEPQVDEGLARDLRSWFAGRGRTMPEGNLKQAWLIGSAVSLPNPLGTAPGWLVTKAGKYIVALPGPPHEMKRMWGEEVVPRLPLPQSRLFRIILKTHGQGESAIAQLLAPFLHSSNPTVATYAKDDGVHVRVAAKAAGAASARQSAEGFARQVEERLGGLVWGRDDAELAGVVIDQLATRNMTLAIADEAGVLGLGEALAAAARGGSVLRGAVVAWSPNTAAALGLPPPSTRPALATEYGTQVAKAVQQALAASLGASLVWTNAGTGRSDAANDEMLFTVTQAGKASSVRIGGGGTRGVAGRVKLRNEALHHLRSSVMAGDV